MNLTKLTIENFAGFKKQTFEFNGQDARVYGANGTGKTTTATALQWLLFDKGLDGSTKSFNPVPLKENNEEDYELIPTVEVELNKDGKTLKIRKESHPKYTKNQSNNRKEYSRSRTKKQYINDESLKVKDFQSRIAELVDEDVFKLITNPAAFNDLEWKKQRELLFEIADQIDDEDIIKTNKDFKDLKDILGDHDIEVKTKILNDKIKQIRKDIEDIPVRINQTESNKQDVPEHDEERYNTVKQKIEQLGNERVDIQNGKAEIDLRNQLADKQAELKRLEDNHDANNEGRIHAATNELSVENGTVANLETTIRNNKQQIEYESKRRQALLSEYHEFEAKEEEVGARQFQPSTDNVCSCCGQALPPEQVEEVNKKALAKFNKQQSEDLENLKRKTEKILSDGKEIKPLIEKLENENNDLQIKVNEAKEKAQRIENRINKLKAGNVDITQTNEYKSILNDINEINQKRKDIKATISDKVAKVDEQINELNQEKVAFENAKAIESSNEHLDEVIKDLRSEEDQLLDKKEDYEHQLYILKEFTTTKVKMLTENINRKFKMANFKLFNHQVNGEIKETCVCTVKGVEYNGGLNNAARINVGLDIINTLSTHYGITAPIFIDNAESVTDIIPTEAQQIQLVVSGQDKTLRMETI
ncbi:AAA family ATPase [Staphylococcus hominis]|uniref:AAA family ATPase n=1 Tax=Staphylococcus hominis TaxID=1290 RepID=UPI001A8D1B80|nr:AAA family ATPase [Staphylococcus hominis]MBO0379831.1 AAA family ATPase [Staphylococcus hominis]